MRPFIRMRQKAAKSIFRRSGCIDVTVIWLVFFLFILIVHSNTKHSATIGVPICNANCLLFLHYSLKNKTEKLNCILYFSRVDHVPLNINKNKIYASSPSSSLFFIDCAVNKREISFSFLVYFSFFALVFFYFILFYS